MAARMAAVNPRNEVSGASTLVNRRDRQVVVAETFGLPRAESSDDYWQHARPLLDQVVLSGQALVVTDIAKDEHFRHRFTPERTDAACDSTAFLCVPIKLGEETMGVLSLDSPVPRPDRSAWQKASLGPC